MQKEPWSNSEELNNLIEEDKIDFEKKNQFLLRAFSTITGKQIDSLTKALQTESKEILFSIKIMNCHQMKNSDRAEAVSKEEYNDFLA